MVGISGEKDRQILLTKDKYGNEIVVFSGWENCEKYYNKYWNVGLDPVYQTQWKQNYPELVVEDILGVWDRLNRKDEDWRRNWLYGDLLKRGVNKWLFVRYMLIRYKKQVADWRDEAYEKMNKCRDSFEHKLHDIRLGYGVPTWRVAENAYSYGYWKGYYDAMRKVRADLKTLCCSPRYIVWNGSKPGFAVDIKISRGWLNLVQELYNVRFEK